jgi:hypothetical protein
MGMLHYITYITFSTGNLEEDHINDLCEENNYEGWNGFV